MRFAWWDIPEDPSFDPAVGGWQAMREPSQRTALIFMNLMALPLMIAIVVLWFVLRGPGNIDIDLRDTSLLTVLVAMVLFFIGYILLMFTHELIHLALMPGWLGSHRHVLVFKLPLALLAHYDGAMSRARFLAVFVGPLTLLTVMPLGLALITQQQVPLLLVFLLALHGGACSGDLLGMTLVTLFVPRGAEVRNLGWKTYWRPLHPE